MAFTIGDCRYSLPSAFLEPIPDRLMNSAVDLYLFAVSNGFTDRLAF